MTGIINEEWRSITGFANYQVSNIGRVRNVKTEKILKPGLQARGYYQATLYKEGKRTWDYVHRLVAREFVDNPEGRLIVDHIDNNKSNNCVNNLRWVNASQNNMNSRKNTKAFSSFKGVYFNKRANKWQAYIKFGEKLTHLGVFENEKEAAKKYNEAAILHFGEYALINEFEESDDEETEEETD